MFCINTAPAESRRSTGSFSTPESGKRAYGKASLLDWLYAVTERAARACGRQVWKLELGESQEPTRFQWYLDARGSWLSLCPSCRIKRGSSSTRTDNVDMRFSYECDDCGECEPGRLGS